MLDEKILSLHAVNTEQYSQNKFTAVTAQVTNIIKENPSWEIEFPISGHQNIIGVHKMIDIAK